MCALACGGPMCWGADVSDPCSTSFNIVVAVFFLVAVFFQPCAIAGKREWVLRSHPSNESPNILDPRMHARLGPRCSSALNWPRMVFADLTHFSHDSIDSLDSTHSTRLLDSQKERSCLAWSHLVLEKFGWMERICACARIPNHCLHTTH